ncbi:hypothetical protein [Spirillospora sp. NBC_01491]|uniref:hypothetical protein n=1 Tax=Spirillospora sp. NBC_01491 TaxID=2976007 RepID=UPI002E331761|nr:hypothetical protein [Spirillospora sp. NBC_01491]
MSRDLDDILTSRTTADLRGRRSVKWREYPPDASPLHTMVTSVQELSGWLR